MGMFPGRPKTLSRNRAPPRARMDARRAQAHRKRAEPPSPGSRGSGGDSDSRGSKKSYLPVEKSEFTGRREKMLEKNFERRRWDVEADAVRALALQEIRQALARFVVRVGDEGESETFLAAMLDYVARWFDGVQHPPAAAAAAEHDRAWEESLRRARADLELRRETDGS